MGIWVGVRSIFLAWPFVRRAKGLEMWIMVSSIKKVGGSVIELSGPLGYWVSERKADSSNSNKGRNAWLNFSVKHSKPSDWPARCAAERTIWDDIYLVRNHARLGFEPFDSAHGPKYVEGSLRLEFLTGEAQVLGASIFQSTSLKSRGDHCWRDVR